MKRLRIRFKRGNLKEDISKYTAQRLRCDMLSDREVTDGKAAQDMVHKGNRYPGVRCIRKEEPTELTG